MLGRAVVWISVHLCDFLHNPQVIKKKAALRNVEKELICDFCAWFMRKASQIFPVDGCANSPDSHAVTFKNSKGLFCAIFGGKKVTEIQKHSEFPTEVFQLC